MQLTKRSVFLGVALGSILLIGGIFSATRLIQEKPHVKPKHGDVVESIYGLGTVMADKVFSVRVGITFSVKKVYVKEGDWVRPGDPLVKLDDAVMRSPIQGTVTAVAYKDGELVTPQVPIVTVTNLERLYLEVSLEQQLILRVKKGQPAYVSFESLRNEKFEGTVSSVYPRDNQFIVRIELKAWPIGVLPGMTADVATLVGKKTNVLLIPLSSIVAGKVYRIRGGKKEHIPVKLGVIDGEWGELVSENILETDELLARK